MKKNFLLTVLLSFIFLVPAYASIEDDATVLYNKGIDLYEQDKVDQSIAAFKKAVTLYPDFYEAYYNLARIQAAAGKPKEAITSYEELLRISPSDYESRYEYAALLYKQGYLSKSLSNLNKIPSGNEYKTKADALSSKIVKRQKELAEESRIKAEQTLKSSVIGNISAPSGLVIDSYGNMYVASFSESIIYKISKDGTQKTVFLDKTGGLNGPIGVAIDSYDNIYVANYTKGSVSLYDKDAKETVLMLIKKPYGISLNEEKAKLYVTEQQNNSVISYDITEILKNSSAKKQSLSVKKEQKSEPAVITAPKTQTPIGTPSIVESSFTNTNSQTKITAPIMIPSQTMFDY